MKEGRIFICKDGGVSIEGKTIDKCRVAISSEETGYNQIIISFTDGTYCVIRIEEDDATYNRCFFDAFCPELSSYGTPPHYVNAYMKVVFEKFIRDQIELGIIEPMTDEDLQKIIDDRNEKIRNAEYKRYLELKAKFETE